MSYPGVVRETLVSLGDRLLWGMQTYGVSTELFGATAYVGFNLALDPKVNYWYCDGVADDVQINAAVAYLVTLGGGSIVLETGTYVLDAAVDLETEVMLIGQGRNTLLNGDALLTGVHAITITSEDDCVVRDLSVQTQDGGGKTCHCIFVDDSSNRTLIQNVTIVDSDDNGIHIEGISQADTRILNCNILGADGHGIYVGMEVANAIYFLKVRDCRFTSMAGDAIHLEDGIDCEIFDNTFDTSIGGDGIELVNSDDVTIENNTMSGATGYDINISDAACDRTRVFNNILHGTGAGCINDVGTDTKTPEIFSVVVDPDTTLGKHPAVDLPDSADTPVTFQILVPLEFQELVTAHVIVAQTATVASPDMQWSTDVDFGKICAEEDYNTHTDAETDQITAITQNDLECIDVSGSLTGLSVGDLVGFEFIRRATQAGDTINDAAYYLGFRLRYV